MRRFGKAAGGWRWAPALWIFLTAPAGALQILEAVDHAELSAEISSREVSRIALEGDRIARVVQSGRAYTLEHDPVRGDLYLYPGEAGPGGPAVATAPPASRAPAISGAPAPLTLYLGTEKGLTYRLTLTPVERASAQILIRNRAASGSDTVPVESRGPGRESAIVALIGAVARREPLPGYVVVPASNVSERDGKNSEAARSAGQRRNGVRPIETWRGPRFTARVLAISDSDPGDAPDLAAVRGPGAVAAWMSDPAGGGAARESAAHGRAAGSVATTTRLAVVVEATGFPEAAP